MSQVLTFDLGTSYFKVCIFDASLKIVAQHRTPVPIVRASPGQAELPVERFRHCITHAVHEVARQAGGLGGVGKVCFASQANSFTLLDDRDQPLTPIILWTDERASGSDALLRAIDAHPDFYRTTGVPRLDRCFMVAKLQWLRTQQPDIYERMRRVAGLSDLLVLWLTGNHLTEAGLAGLTGLIDIHQLDYWPAALQTADLAPDQLPAICRAGNDAGRVRPEVADAWGLPSECRLVMGCLDQYAGAIGAGNSRPGGVSETTGTVLATVRCAASFHANKVTGLFQGPASVPGRYYQMLFSDVSAMLLERYRDALPERATFEELDALAAAVPDGAGGVRLHPDAPRLPVSQMFVGWDGAASNDAPSNGANGRGQEVRAIMEGVASELRRQVEVLCHDAWPTSIPAAGGASRSPLWLRIKSRTLGCPVYRLDCCEAASLGAARLASQMVE